jgi:hypothetical protein
MEQVTLEKEKILNKSESSTSPVIPLWMAGFLFAANQIFRASSFRSDSPSWPP